MWESASECSAAPLGRAFTHSQRQGQDAVRCPSPLIWLVCRLQFVPWWILARGHWLAPAMCLLSVILYSVSLARLYDRRASGAPGRIHYSIMSRSQGTQRWPAHPGPRSPPFGNQRPDACMRVLVDLQGPPKGPPSPLSHTVLHAPPPLRVSTATREVPSVPRSVCDSHPHPCVHRIRMRLAPSPVV